jgi:hypothetical protein
MNICQVLEADFRGKSVLLEIAISKAATESRKCYQQAEYSLYYAFRP